ncbi:MAG: hypothetical protein AAFQ98_20615 [Bacteroidota bacterium]
MKKLLCYCLAMLVTAQVEAQEVVSLRAIPMATGAIEKVYVQSVTDERANHHLGVQENLYGESVALMLQGGLESAVKSFYGLSFAKDSLSTPIHIRVKALNLQWSKRRMNDGITNVARAHVEMVFCLVEGNNYREVFRIKHNEDEVFELFDRPGIYSTHEKRIRAALEYCMHAFLNQFAVQKPLVSSPDFKPTTENEKLDAQLGQWFNLVTLKGLRSRFYRGYGISYTGFVDSKKGFIRPYETSFEITWAVPNVAEDNGFAEVNSYVFRPELYFIYKKLFEGVYASASANLPIGFESLVDLDGNNSLNFVIGAGASQGIRIIPWQRRGVVLGIDFFQQFETSKVFRLDLGAELVVGVNF